MLAQTFYVSKSTFASENVVDNDILYQAGHNNPKLELTGCLFRAANLYGQILEGPVPSIEDMMRAIRLDARHFDIIEWPITETTARAFPDWSMGYAKREFADAELAAFGYAQPRQISEVAEVLKSIFEVGY